MKRVIMGRIMRSVSQIMRMIHLKCTDDVYKQGEKDRKFLLLTTPGLRKFLSLTRPGLQMFL